MDFSVVVPSSGDPLGLWTTAISLAMDIEAGGHNAEIVPVLNGASVEEAREVVSGLPYVRVVEAGSTLVTTPQAARNHGMQNTKTDIVFFVDSHVQVPRFFFKHMLEDMDSTGASALSAWHRFNEEAPVAPAFGFNMWESFQAPHHNGKPFRVAMHSHGAFAIRRDAYEQVGGYWRALKGFGGEEMQLSLKLWFMGYTCWSTPRTFHWHYVPMIRGRHEYAALFSDYNYCENHLMVAAAYDPSGAMLREAYRWLVNQHWGRQELYPDLPKVIDACREVRYERDDVQLRGKYKTMNELRTMFYREGVIQ